MCYKDELNVKNNKLLQAQFERDNIPILIRNYFLNQRSGATKLNYWTVIKDCLSWLIDNKYIPSTNTISDLTLKGLSYVLPGHINAYLEYMEKEKEYSLTTLSMRKHVLESFWRYLISLSDSPIRSNVAKDAAWKGIKEDNSSISTRKMATEEQIEKMMKNIAKKKDPFIRERNEIILRVLKGTGIRESELAGLDRNDVYIYGDERESRPFIKVLGKGKYRQQEARLVLLTGDATSAFVEWENVRPNNADCPAVFVNKNGKRLNEDNIKSIFRSYGDGITPHMIRHYYATIMMQKYGIEFVTQQVGHVNMNLTTDVYVNGTYGINLLDD